MKKLIFALLPSILVLSVFHSDIRAQSFSTYTDMYYYNWNGHNEYVSKTTTIAEFSLDYYYCVQVDTYLTQDEDENTTAWNSSYLCGPNVSTFWAEGSLPYVASSSYEGRGETRIDARYVGESGGYYDPYGFNYYDILYNQGQGVWAPLLYGFNGSPNYDNWLDYANIFLGTVYSYKENTSQSKSGPPHHLKVLDDNITTLPNSGSSCGQKQRKIKYLVVDEQGRAAGKTTLGERIPSGVISTCTNVAPEITSCFTYSGSNVSRSESNSKGEFTDTIRVGCPQNGPAPAGCGYVFDPNKWITCPEPYKTNYQVLATIKYEVRKEKVVIDERETPWSAGKEFFP